MLFVDVDHFKRVNDEHGHAVGDRLIAVLGTTLARNVRPGDQVARYGGEEFVVVADATDVADLVTLAERLRMLIGQSGVSVPEGRVGVTVSIGVAMAAAGDTAAMVLDRADQRLLAAKRAGRDRVVDTDRELPPARERTGGLRARRGAEAVSRAGRCSRPGTCHGSRSSSRSPRCR